MSGAVHVTEHFPININGCIFEENSSQNYGGALAVENGGIVYINSSNITKNIGIEYL